MYDRVWNEYLLTKIPTSTCFVSRSRNFANDVIYHSKAALRSFGMNPGKMSRVGEVGERLGVVAWEDTSGRGPQRVRNYTARWLIKNTM